MTIISLPPPLLPSHPLPYPQPAWIFNIDKSPSSPPQSPSPGIHLSSGRFTKDISFGKSEDSSIYKIPVRKPRPWIVVLIFTTLFSHPPVGNVNIEFRKSRNNLFNLVYLDSSINSSITYKNNYLFKYLEEIFLKKNVNAIAIVEHVHPEENRTPSTDITRIKQIRHSVRVILAAYIGPVSLRPSIVSIKPSFSVLLPLLSPDQPNHPSGTTLFQPRPQRER